MSVEERLSRLERQNRWLKRLGALAIAVGAVVVLVAQAREKEPQHLVVKSLGVKDEDGRVRALLDVAPNGSVSLWLGAKGEKLGLEFPIPALSLAVSPEGLPNLAFGDKGLTTRMTLGAVDSDTWGLRLVDSDRSSQARLEAKARGPALLGLDDKNGKRRVTLSVGDFGHTVLDLRDEDHNTRALLELHPDGSPRVRLNDETGKVIWKAPGE
jgi:hypothetical protein